jgi:YHS domain-containing protein
MQTYNLAELELTDPVCGAATSAKSPDICAYGGAMFHFCSDTCCSIFKADPSHFVAIDAVVLGYYTQPPALTPPGFARLATSPVAVVPAASADKEHKRADSSPLAQAVQGPEGRTENAGIRAWIASWWQTRQERRIAVSTCKELIALYRKISADHPGLGERHRLKLLVMTRNSCDEAAAYEVLKYAQESFAAWPVSRELTLTDVIHYLMVTEFATNHGGEYCMRISIAEEINSLVPNKLSRARKKQPYVVERRMLVRSKG